MWCTSSQLCSAMVNMMMTLHKTLSLIQRQVSQWDQDIYELSLGFKDYSSNFSLFQDQISNLCGLIVSIGKPDLRLKQTPQNSRNAADGVTFSWDSVQPPLSFDHSGGCNRHQPFYCCHLKRWGSREFEPMSSHFGKTHKYLCNIQLPTSYEMLNV